jgi:threonine dehydrogenase-like Zn-dependent dehydrogenase
MEAKQALFTARGKVSLETVTVGEPDENQLLVETLYTAISPGTERAFLLAEPNTITQRKGFPFPPGYSNVGRVRSVGSAVKHFRPGDHIATRRPHVSHYLIPETLGPGEVAEKYREEFRSPIAPEAPAIGLHYLWKLPAELDDAALKASAPFGIVSVGVTGARYGRIDLGESVLVIGLGPVGLYAAQSARLAGGFPVLGLDPVAARRELALKLGADAAYATPEVLAKGHPLMGGKAPNVVIEATGRPDVVNLALKLCGPNGRVVLLGSTRGVTPNVDFYTDVHRKGLTIIGAQVLTRPVLDNSDGRWNAWDENALVLRLIASGRLDTQPLIEHEFPASRVADAYRLIEDSPETLGVLLTWQK